MSGRSTVGRALAHDAAILHVSGQARYVDDIPLPEGTLHLAFGLSQVARGEIEAMDLAPVAAAPRVVAVLTALDLPGANDVSPSAHDEPLLSDGLVHYCGQPLFLVVAESHRAARAATRLARVSIREEPPVLSIDDALAAGWQFEEPMVFAKGDVEAALQSAPHVVEGTLEVGGQEHFYLEGQAAAAVPGDGGEMVIHSSTQHPTEIQHKVAEALGCPMSQVRVEVRRMGGGFGGKESQGNALAVACAVAADHTGRPCKMRYDRDDDMIITGKRHDLRISYRAGFDKTGRLTGVAFEHFVRCGWAQDLSLPVADRAMLHADNAYHLPAARITSHRLRTNTQSATAFRGFGGPQGMIGIERVMDHIAWELGLDPLKVRRVNYYADHDADADPEADAAPQRGTGAGAAAGTGAGGKDAGDARQGAAPQTTPYHMAVEDCVIGQLTETLSDSADYAGRREAIAEWNAANPILKRGIALTPVKFGISFTLTHLNQAGALVHVYQDGSIRLNHGGTEMGQGLFIKVAQVAAEVLGQPIDAVRITATDTAKVPNTSATAASSGSDLNGMAVRQACETIKGRLQTFLALRHGCRPNAVSFRAGRVRAGDTELDWAEVIRAAYEARIPLSATGYYATPKIEWDRRAGEGRPFFYFAYGAACSEVVIDTLTGENRVLRTDILHDVGKSLNPAIDLGQVQGGFVQGMGWLTTEELVWDTAGRLRTHAPSTYKIPAASDRPAVFNVRLWDKGRNAEDTIYRSKAVGEPPFMLGISVWSALSDAVRAAGDPARPVALNAPATPEAILRAVKAQRGGQLDRGHPE